MNTSNFGTPNVQPSRIAQLGSVASSGCPLSYVQPQVDEISRKVVIFNVCWHFPIVGAHMQWAVLGS
jgi:hypothetical protein